MDNVRKRSIECPSQPFHVDFLPKATFHGGPRWLDSWDSVRRISIAFWTFNLLNSITMTFTSSINLDELNQVGALLYGEDGSLGSRNAGRWVHHFETGWSCAKNSRGRSRRLEETPLL